jgi:hypothetical protein
MLSPLSLYVQMHLNKRSSHFRRYSLIHSRCLRLHQVSIYLELLDLLLNLLPKHLFLYPKHFKRHQIYDLLHCTHHLILIMHQPRNLMMMHLRIPTATLSVHLRPLPVKLVLKNEPDTEYGIAEDLVELQEEAVLVVADRLLILTPETQGLPVVGLERVEQVVVAVQEGLQLLVHEEVSVSQGKGDTRDQKRAQMGKTDVIL